MSTVLLPRGTRDTHPQLRLGVELLVQTMKGRFGNAIPPMPRVGANARVVCRVLRDGTSGRMLSIRGRLCSPFWPPETAFLGTDAKRPGQEPKELSGTMGMGISYYQGPSG